MAEEPLRRWSESKLALDIARALLLAVPDALTAPEMADAVGGDSSNLKKEADRLADAGLIERTTPTIGVGRGRRATVAYALTDRQRADAEAELQRASPPGVLAEGHELVFASTATPHLRDLLAVLAESQELGRASWAAFAGDEILLSVGRTADAIHLVAILDAARIPTRRATVSRVVRTDTLVRQARGASRSARRARLARDTRSAEA